MANDDLVKQAAEAAASVSAYGNLNREFLETALVGVAGIEESNDAWDSSGWTHVECIISHALVESEIAKGIPVATLICTFIRNGYKNACTGMDGKWCVNKKVRVRSLEEGWELSMCIRKVGE